MFGRGENAGFHHFSPFPTMFSKDFLLRVIKVRFRGKGLKYGFLKAVGDCESDNPECERMLTENPKLCEEHQQFAWHTCRKTCGYEGKFSNFCFSLK